MHNKKAHIKLYKKVLGKENFSHLYNKIIFITGATGFLGMWLLRTIDYLNKTLSLNIKVIILLRSKNKKIIEVKDIKPNKLVFLKPQKFFLYLQN